MSAAFLPLNDEPVRVAYGATGRAQTESVLLLALYFSRVTSLFLTCVARLWSHSGLEERQSRRVSLGPYDNGEISWSQDLVAMDMKQHRSVLGMGSEDRYQRFQCSHCWHTWQSAQVHVLFHMHLDRKQRQGWVKMRLFRQECKKCLEPNLEPPEFSQENVEKVLDNLMLKIRGKCYRESINPNDLVKIVVEDQTTGPHDSARCEACRQGICYVKYDAQAPANSFFRPASLFPRVVPAQQERSGAEAGSTNERGSSCVWWHCFTCGLVIILAVLIFVVLYFTIM